ncbi:DUF2634 domain-containing protein [Paenibacillus sp. 481]|uniref:DUF2634 domain-containing protein n=1 Tax=Paenibacillus sp. 481 TaxID=2835869 RepID=UPI001E46B94D|nr:DUF2634 domain-containing protein [Paenibacillus sp. 481]UHA72302.1 DUF2634 domain-containing protein [Paenibacillus sp. 481]
MIPKGAILEPQQGFGELEQDLLFDAEVLPSRTYGLDIAAGRITRMTDGLEAVKQAIYKQLQTERFAYLIYSSDYGSELQSRIGYGLDVVQAELQRTISEALLADDRVTDVGEFEFEQQADCLLVQFVVDTIFGKLQMERGVNIDG